MIRKGFFNGMHFPRNADLNLISLSLSNCKIEPIQDEQTEIHYTLHAANLRVRHDQRTG